MIANEGDLVETESSSLDPISVGVPPRGRSEARKPAVDLGHWNKVYTNPEYFQQYTQRPGLQAGAENTPFPETYFKREANIAYLSQLTSTPLEDMGMIYEDRKNQLARATTGASTISDEGLFDYFKTQFDGINEKQGVVDQIFQDVLQDGVKQSFEGKGVNYLPLLSQKLDEAGEMFSEEERTQIRENIQGVMLPIARVQDAVAPEARWIFDMMAQQTGRPDAEIDEEMAGFYMDSAIQKFAELERPERQRVYNLVQAFAAVSGQDKTVWQQMGESLSRGLSDIYERVPRNWNERDMMSAQQQLEAGEPLYVIKSQSGKNTFTMTPTAPATGGDMAELGTLAVQQAMDQTEIREATPAERETFTQDVRKKLKGLDVERELRDLAQTSVDPIKVKSTGYWSSILEEGMYSFARSAPYTALAGLPFRLGLFAVGNVLYAQNYDQLRLDYPELDPRKAAALAAFAAPIEAVTERFKYLTLTGRLPFLGGLFRRLNHPARAPWTRILFGFGAINAEQNVQEIIQENTLPFFQTIASALMEDIPEYDWATRMEGMPRELMVQFVALFPMTLLGGGALSYREIKRGEEYMKDRQNLQEAGFEQAAIDRVVSALTPEEAQQALIEETGKLTDEQRMKGYERIVERLMGEQEQAPNLPGPRIVKNSKEPNTYDVLDTDGESVADGVGVDEALSVHRNLRMRQLIGLEEVQARMIQFYLDRSERRKEGGLDEDVNLDLQLITQEEMDKISQMTPEQWEQRIREWEIEHNRKATPDMKFGVRGRADVREIAERMYEQVVRVTKARDPSEVFRVVEEMAEGHLKLMYQRGSLNEADVLTGLRQYETASGETLLVENFDALPPEQQARAIVEAFSTLAVSYFTGQVDKGTIPEIIASFIRVMQEYLASMLARANLLQQGLESGQIGSDFEILLAESVGLDADARVMQRATAKRNAVVTGQSVSADGSLPSYAINVNVAPVRTDRLDKMTKGEMMKRAKSPKFIHLQQISTEIASAYGVKITARYPVIGGWTEDGRPSLEVPEAIIFETDDLAMASEMAALIAITAPELQNAAFVWQYAKDGPHAEYKFQAKSADTAYAIAQNLEDAGVQGFSYDPKTREFSIVSMGDDGNFESKLHEFIQEQSQQGRIGSRGRVEKALGESRFPGEAEYKDAIASARVRAQSAGRGQGESLRAIADRAQRRLDRSEAAKVAAQKAEAILSTQAQPRMAASRIETDLKGRQFDNIRAFGVWLDERFSRQVKKSAYEIGSKDGLENASNALLYDVLDGLAKDGSGMGWYDERVQETLRELASLHPEFNDDPFAMAVYIGILAATSQGYTVVQNFGQADRVYEDYKRTGRIPTGYKFAQSSPAINGNLQLIQQLIDTYGLDGYTEFMDGEVTGRAIRDQYGLKAAGVTLADVTRGNAVMGQKIGSFFNNLRGRFDTITMDLWYTRTMHRYLGETVVPLATPKLQTALAKLRAELKKPGVRTYGIDVERAMKEDEYGVQAGMRIMQKWGAGKNKYSEKGYFKFPDGYTVEKAARRINALGGMKGAPQNKTHRNYFAQIVRTAKSKLEALGITLTEADIQAIIWYREKNLFGTVGRANVAAKPADYLDAAMGLKRSRGVDTTFAISPEQDTDYLAAVERGDMETAQRMVDEAARAAGYNYGPLFHSRLTPFNAFEKYGKFIGVSGVSGIHLTDSKQMAQRYLDRYGSIGFVNDKPYQPFQKEIIRVYAKITNPLRRQEPLLPNVDLGAPVPKNYQSPVERMGYDALIRDEAISKKGPVNHSQAKNAIRGTEIILTDPNKIKSADPVTYDDQGNVIPLSQRFDATKPQITYAIAPEGFYSQMERALESKIQGKSATPEQVKAIIQNPQNRVKPDEIKWSGIMPAIDRIAAENNGKVPKEALLQYVRDESRVKFQEVTYEQTIGPSRDGYVKQLGATAEDEAGFAVWSHGRPMAAFPPAAPIQKRTINGIEFNLPVFPTYMAASNWLDAYRQRNPEVKDTTSFSEYQLPGGTDYRELVLTMEDELTQVQKRKDRNSTERAAIFTSDEAYDDMGQFTVYAQERIEQLDAEFNSLNARLGMAGFGNTVLGTAEQLEAYRSGHFADVGDYVAHMRVNTRTDASDMPGKFIEELQSDRHQRGRKEGYADADKRAEPPPGIVLRDLGAERQASGYADILPGTAGWRYEYGDGLSAVYETRDDAIEAAWRTYDYARADKGPVPDAPFRKDWPIALFKRALRDAVKEDLQWIGWTNGVTQVDRYTEALRQRVKSINWTSEDGLTVVDVQPQQGNRIYLPVKDGKIYRTADEQSLVGKDLADVIGKEAAAKVGEAESGKLTGQDLTIGGEGMKGFYDNILPKEIGKYVKQWGGKVEQATIGQQTTNNDLDMGDLNDAIDNRPVIWRVQLTPEIKAGVAAGQPTFAIAPEPDSYSFNEVRLPNGNVKFFAYHGSEATFSALEDRPIYVSSMEDGAGYGTPVRVIVEGKFLGEYEVEEFAGKNGISMEDLFHEEASREEDFQQALRAEGYDGAMYYDQRRDDGDVIPAAIIVNPSAIKIDTTPPPASDRLVGKAADTHWLVRYANGQMGIEWGISKDAVVNVLKGRYGESQWVEFVDGIDRLTPENDPNRGTFAISPDQYYGDLEAAVTALDNDPTFRRERVAMVMGRLKAIKRMYENNPEPLGMVEAIADMEAIISLLPPEARTRVGGFRTLAGLKTAKGRLNYLKKRIMAADKELEAYLRKEFTYDIETMIERALPRAGDNKVQKGVVGVQGTKVAQMADRIVAMTTDEVSSRMSEVEAAMIAPDLDPDRQSDLLEEWGLLNTLGDLYKRTASELDAARIYLRQTFAAGRTGWKIIEEARKEEVKLMAEELAEKLKKVTPQSLKAQDPGSSYVKQFMEWSKGFMLSHWSFQQLLRTYLPQTSFSVDWADRARRADIESTRYATEGALRLLAAIGTAIGSNKGRAIGKAYYGMRQIQKGKIRVLAGREVTMERISIQLATDILEGNASAKEAGLTGKDLQALREAVMAVPLMNERTDSAGRPYLIPNRTRFVEWERVLSEGVEEKLDMSPAEAIQFLLSWGQENVQERMRRQGWTDDSVADMDAMVDAMPGTRAAINFLKDEYLAGGDVADPVYKRMFGMSMPRIENYAPTRYMNRDDTNDLGPFGAMPGMTGMTPGPLKGRVNHNARMRQEDAFSVYTQHVVQMGHWLATAELNREIRAVMKNPKVREGMEATFGRPVVQLFDKWVDSLAQKGSAQAAELAIDNKFLNMMVAGKSISSLGGNLRTIFMQTDAGGRMMFEMPFKEIAKATANLPRLLADMPKAWNSDTVQRRIVEGTSPEIRFIFESARLKPTEFLRLASFSMMPMVYTDTVLTSVVAAMVYRYHYNQATAAGAKPAEAEKTALDAMDRAVYNFAQPIDTTSRSLREVSGAKGVRIFMMFQSDMRLKSALLSEGLYGLVNGPAEKRAGYARQVSAIMLLALINQTMSNLFRDWFSDEPDEDIWTWEGYAMAMMLAPFSGLFLVGAAADVALSRLMGQRSFSGAQNPLISSAEKGTTALFNMDKLTSDDPQEVMRQMDAMAKAISFLGPKSAAPAAVINALKPIEGAYRNATSPEEKPPAKQKTSNW